MKSTGRKQTVKPPSNRVVTGRRHARESKKPSRFNKHTFATREEPDVPGRVARALRAWFFTSGVVADRHQNPELWRKPAEDLIAGLASEGVVPQLVANQSEDDTLRNKIMKIMENHKRVGDASLMYSSQLVDDLANLLNGRPTS